MLEYVKTILIKVSFDKNLFKRELEKSIKWLTKDEIIELKQWALARFKYIYDDIINEVFADYEYSIAN